MDIIIGAIVLVFVVVITMLFYMGANYTAIPDRED